MVIISDIATFTTCMMPNQTTAKSCRILAHKLCFQLSHCDVIICATGNRMNGVAFLSYVDINLPQYDQNDKEDSKLIHHIIVLNKKLIKPRTYIVTTALEKIHIF